MSKNKKHKVNKKQKYSSRKKENSQSSFELPSFLTNDTFFLVASLVLALIYFGYSFFSEGFYQHDEAGHYLNMRSFWYNPNGILSTWSKPGFKLIYAIPSFFGLSFVTFLNCVFAAFCSFFAYKVVQKFNPNIAFLAFILLATQHMWINLSFRNYSELISAFLLILFTFLHYDKKEFFAALALSYLCTIRQEAYIIAGFYFFHLLYDKKYWYILALALFPFLQNLWGAILNSDPLYLLNSIISTGGGYQDAFPRQGFDHYLKFSPHTYGAIAITLVITFFYSLLFKWKKALLVILVPGLIFWLLQCIFAWQSVKIGPSNAGNLRYLLVFSPLIAVWGTLGLGNFNQLNKQQKWGSLVVLLPFLIYVFSTLSYKIQLFTFLEERDWIPTISVIGTIGILYLGLSAFKKSVLIAIFSILMAFAAVKPYPLSPEDKTVKELVSWFKGLPESEKQGQLIANHTMFFYFIDKIRQEFPKPVVGLSMENLALLSQGEYIIWDSHYGYRPSQNPNAINYTYFSERPNEYRLVNQYLSIDKRFAAIVFQKL